MAKKNKKVKKDKIIKKDKFDFGSIFNETFEDYKRNFKPILKFMLLFVGLPALIFYLVKFAFDIFDKNLFLIESTPYLSKVGVFGILGLPGYFNIVTIIFAAISICLMVLVSGGIIGASLKKSKFTYKELVENGQRRYERYFLFNIVMIIFLVLLTILFIIPGIIFAIYWLLAEYVFFDKNEKILPSLKQSRMMLKHRWWKMFGYFLLLSIIVMIWSGLASLIQLPTVLINTFHIMNKTPLSLGFLGIDSLLGVIANFVGAVVYVPFVVLFFKNVYLKIRKK